MAFVFQKLPLMLDLENSASEETWHEQKPESTCVHLILVKHLASFQLEEKKNHLCL